MPKLFTNAYIPTKSAALKKVNVLFDRRIIKISQDEIITEENPEIINLNGRLLLPGAVDMHCHLGQDASAISRITRSAISGGWTTLANMDFFPVDPIFRPVDLLTQEPVINDAAWCDIALWGHVDVDDYPYYAETAQDLWNAGIVGLIVLNPSPSDQIATLTYSEMMDLFLNVYSYDAQFSFSGYDTDVSPVYTPDAHISAVKKLLRRMQENPIHIRQISHFSTLEFINSISKRSDISCALKIADLMREFSHVAIAPATINSDFADFSEELELLFKTNKIYVLTNLAALPEPLPPQFTCFAGEDYALMHHSVTYILSEFWKKRKTPLATCIKMISENPAKRLGLYPRKGAITAGADADFIIFDQNGSTDTGLKTHSGEPLVLEGAIDAVYLAGEPVVNTGKPLHRRGSLVKRTASPKKRHNTQSWI